MSLPLPHHICAKFHQVRSCDAAQPQIATLQAMETQIWALRTAATSCHSDSNGTHIAHQHSSAGAHPRRSCVCARAYTPSPLDPSMQAAQTAVVLFALVALPATWWLIVVPTSRKKLATDKRKGAHLLRMLFVTCGVRAAALMLSHAPISVFTTNCPRRVGGAQLQAPPWKFAGPLRKYLESVDAGDNQVTKWFFAKWLRQMPGRDKARARRAVADAHGDAAAVQSQASEQHDADTISQRASGPAQGSASKPGSEKFFSGDNPLVVVAWVLGIFVAVQVALHPR